MYQDKNIKLSLFKRQLLLGKGIRSLTYREALRKVHTSRALHHIQKNNHGKKTS